MHAPRQNSALIHRLWAGFSVFPLSIAAVGFLIESPGFSSSSNLSSSPSINPRTRCCCCCARCTDDCFSTSVTRLVSLPHTHLSSFAARHHARSCQDELRSSTQVSAGDPAGERQPLPQFCLVSLGLAVVLLYSAYFASVSSRSRSSPSS